MSEVEITLSGKVQAVGFRIFAQRRAEELGVTGWVANTEDGEVEIVAQGEKENLEEFVEKIKRGPTFAKVEDVEIEWHEKPSDTFTEFTIEE